MLTYSPPHAPYFSVIHNDDELIVLDKPSGLLTVPGKPESHRDCLESRVQGLFPDARIVHRLDMDTSGICIMAHGKPPQRHLSMQFEKRSVKKSYIAVVAGRLPAAEGEVDLPLICDWPNRPKQIVDHVNGKASLTKWIVLEENNSVSIVRLFPMTGRSHQLRVHMQALGCPILGDNFYASEQILNAAKRLMLHAEFIEFRHPNGGEWVSFRSPRRFEESAGRWVSLLP